MLLVTFSMSLIGPEFALASSFSQETLRPDTTRKTRFSEELRKRLSGKDEAPSRFVEVFQKVNPNANPLTPKAIVVDLDGTIIDSLPQIDRNFGKLYFWVKNLTSKEPKTGEDLREGIALHKKTAGDLLTDQIPALLEEIGTPERQLQKLILQLVSRYNPTAKAQINRLARQDSLAEAFIRIFEEELLREFQRKLPERLPGAIEAIKHISSLRKSLGSRMYIGTGNTQRVAEGILKILGIENCFDGVFGTNGPVYFKEGKASILRHVQKELSDEAGADIKDSEIQLWADQLNDMASSKKDGKGFVSLAIISKSNEGLAEELANPENGTDFLIYGFNNLCPHLDKLGFLSSAARFAETSKESEKDQEGLGLAMAELSQVNPEARSIFSAPSDLKSTESARPIADRHTQIASTQQKPSRMTGRKMRALHEIDEIVTRMSRDRLKRANALEQIDRNAEKPSVFSSSVEETPPATTRNRLLNRLLLTSGLVAANFIAEHKRTEYYFRQIPEVLQYAIPAPSDGVTFPPEIQELINKKDAETLAMIATSDRNPRRAYWALLGLGRLLNRQNIPYLSYKKIVDLILNIRNTKPKLGRLAVRILRSQMIKIYHENRGIRAVAAYFIGIIGGKDAFDILTGQGIGLNDSNPFVRRFAAIGLGRGASSKDASYDFAWQALASLYTVINDTDTSVRRCAVDAAGDIAKTHRNLILQALKVLGSRLDDEDVHVRRAAVFAVGKIAKYPHAKRILTLLSTKINDGDRSIRESAIATIRRISRYSKSEIALMAVEALVPAINDEDVKIRQNAISAIGVIVSTCSESIPQALELIAPSLDAENVDIARNAVDAIASIGRGHSKMAQQALKLLAPRMNHEETYVRRTTIYNIARIGTAHSGLALRSLHMLIGRLSHTKDVTTTREAIRGIGSIGTAHAEYASMALTALNRAMHTEEYKGNSLLVRAVREIGQAHTELASRVIPMLLTRIDDKYSWIAKIAAEGIGNIACRHPRLAQQAMLEVSKKIKAKDADVRKGSLAAVGKIGTVTPTLARQALAALTAEDTGVNDIDENVAASAARGLTEVFVKYQDLLREDRLRMLFGFIGRYGNREALGPILKTKKDLLKGLLNKIIEQIRQAKSIDSADFNIVLYVLSIPGTPLQQKAEYLRELYKIPTREGINRTKRSLYLLSIASVVQGFSDKERQYCDEHAPHAMECAEKLLANQTNPAYDVIFDKDTNPEQEFNLWLYAPLNSECYVELFDKKMQDAKSVETVGGVTIYKTTLNGKKVTVYFDPRGDSNNYRGEIFEHAGKPKVHGMFYSGHTGMGGNLVRALETAPDVDMLQASHQIIGMLSCDSSRAYLGPAKVLFPLAQFVITTTSTSANYDPDTFWIIIDGITQELPWPVIKKRVREKVAENRARWIAQGGKALDPRYLFPHEREEQFRCMDLDGDGRPDQTPEGIIFMPRLGIIIPSNRPTLDREIVNIDMSRVRTAKGSHAVHTVAYYFGFNDYLLDLKEKMIPAGFIAPHYGDSEEACFVSKDTVGDSEAIYKISINKGYIHKHEAVITMMLFQELNEHFTAEKKGHMTNLDRALARVRTLQMVVDFIDRYRQRWSFVTDLFPEFLEKYEYPKVSLDAIRKTMDKYTDADRQTAIEKLLKTLGCEEDINRDLLKREGLLSRFSEQDVPLQFDIQETTPNITHSRFSEAENADALEDFDKMLDQHKPDAFTLYKDSLPRKITLEQAYVRLRKYRFKKTGDLSPNRELWYRRKPKKTKKTYTSSQAAGKLGITKTWVNKLTDRMEEEGLIDIPTNRKGHRVYSSEHIRAIRRYSARISRDRDNGRNKKKTAKKKASSSSRFSEIQPKTVRHMYTGDSLRISQGTYDYLARSYKIIAYLKTNRIDLAGKDIWDLGTASGVLGMYAAGEGGHVVATDIKETACEDAKYNVEQAGLQDRMEVRQGDFDECLSDDEKFDFILCHPPLFPTPIYGTDPNTYDEQFTFIKKLLASLSKRLKEGGRLIILYPNKELVDWAKWNVRYGVFDIEALRDNLKTQGLEIKRPAKTRLRYFVPSDSIVWDIEKQAARFSEDGASRWKFGMQNAKCPKKQGDMGTQSIQDVNFWRRIYLPLARRGLIIEEQIGFGGHTYVYRAVDPKKGENFQVAVRIEKGEGHSKIENLQIAKGLIAKMNGAPPALVNIITAGTISTSGTGEKLTYHELEYVDGPSLIEALPEMPGLNRRLWIIAQVFEGIAFLHDKKVFHGDLSLLRKNILLDSQGYPKIIDPGYGHGSFVSANDVTQVRHTGLRNIEKTLYDIQDLALVAYQILLGPDTEIPDTLETAEEELQNARVKKTPSAQQMAHLASLIYDMKQGECNSMADVSKRFQSIFPNIASYGPVRFSEIRPPLRHELAKIVSNVDIETVYTELHSSRKLSGSITPLLDHIQRVRIDAATLAEELKVDEPDRKVLDAAAALHDIGKLYRRNLWKLVFSSKVVSEDPDDPERQLIDKHAGFSVELLEILGINVSDDVKTLIRNHHHPERIKDARLRRLCEILLLVDVMDALLDDRSYKEAKWHVSDHWGFIEKFPEISESYYLQGKCLHWDIREALLGLIFRGTFNGGLYPNLTRESFENGPPVDDSTTEEARFSEVDDFQTRQRNPFRIIDNINASIFLATTPHGDERYKPERILAIEWLTSVLVDGEIPHAYQQDVDMAKEAIDTLISLLHDPDNTVCMNAAAGLVYADKTRRERFSTTTSGYIPLRSLQTAVTVLRKELVSLPAGDIDKITCIDALSDLGQIDGLSEEAPILLVGAGNSLHSALAKERNNPQIASELVDALVWYATDKTIVAIVPLLQNEDEQLQQRTAIALAHILESNKLNEELAKHKTAIAEFLPNRLVWNLSTYRHNPLAIADGIDKTAKEMKAFFNLCRQVRDDIVIIDDREQLAKYFFEEIGKNGLCARSNLNIAKLIKENTDGRYRIDELEECYEQGLVTLEAIHKQIMDGIRETRLRMALRLEGGTLHLEVSNNSHPGELKAKIEKKLALADSGDGLLEHPEKAVDFSLFGGIEKHHELEGVLKIGALQLSALGGGIFLLRRFAKNRNGDMEVSFDDHWTTFSFYIPLDSSSDKVEEGSSRFAELIKQDVESWLEAELITKQDRPDTIYEDPETIKQNMQQIASMEVSKEERYHLMKLAIELAERTALNKPETAKKLGIDLDRKDEYPTLWAQKDKSGHSLDDIDDEATAIETKHPYFVHMSEKPPVDFSPEDINIFLGDISVNPYKKLDDSSSFAEISPVPAYPTLMEIIPADERQALMNELRKLGFSGGESEILGQISLSSNSVRKVRAFDSSSKLLQNALQLDLIREDLRRLINKKLESGEEKNLAYCVVGLGLVPRETLQLVRSSVEILKEVVGAEAAKEWQIQVVGIDPDELVLKNAKPIFKKTSSSYKKEHGIDVSMQVHEGNAFNRKGLVDIVKVFGTKADYLVHRYSPHMMNNLAKNGLLTKGIITELSHELISRIQNLVKIYIAVSNLIEVFAKPGSRFIIDPLKEIVNLGGNIAPVFLPPNARIVTVRELMTDDIASKWSPTELPFVLCNERHVSNQGTGIIEIIGIHPTGLEAFLDAIENSTAVPSRFTEIKGDAIQPREVLVLNQRENQPEKITIKQLTRLDPNFEKIRQGRFGWSREELYSNKEVFLGIREGCDYALEANRRKYIIVATRNDDSIVDGSYTIIIDGTGTIKMKTIEISPKNRDKNNPELRGVGMELYKAAIDFAIGAGYLTHETPLTQPLLQCLPMSRAGRAIAEKVGLAEFDASRPVKSWNRKTALLFYIRQSLLSTDHPMDTGELLNEDNLGMAYSEAETKDVIEMLLRSGQIRQVNSRYINVKNPYWQEDRGTGFGPARFVENPLLGAQDSALSRSLLSGNKIVKLSASDRYAWALTVLEKIGQLTGLPFDGNVDNSLDTIDYAKLVFSRYKEQPALEASLPLADAFLALNLLPVRGRHPYRTDDNLADSFSNMDMLFSNNISDEIRLQHEELGRPVRVLLVGDAGGLTAISIMDLFEDSVEIHSYNKEPDLTFEFDTAVRQCLMVSGLSHVTPRKIEGYLEQIKQRCYPVNVEEDELLQDDLSEGFDVIIVCRKTAQYFHDKFKTLERLRKSLRVGGVVYANVEPVDYRTTASEEFKREAMYEALLKLSSTEPSLSLIPNNVYNIFMALRNTGKPFRFPFTLHSATYDWEESNYFPILFNYYLPAEIDPSRFTETETLTDEIIGQTSLDVTTGIILGPSSLAEGVASIRDHFAEGVLVAAVVPSSDTRYRGLIAELNETLPDDETIKVFDSARDAGLWLYSQGAQIVRYIATSAQEAKEALLVPFVTEAHVILEATLEKLQELKVIQEFKRNI